MTDDLFNLPPSEPPLIVTLRKAYKEAKCFYDQCVESDDETGECSADFAIDALDTAQKELIAEEARLARL